MHLNHSLRPNCDSRVSSLRSGDFFVAKAFGQWDGDLWRSLYFCSGITAPSRCIFRAVMTSVGPLSSSDPRVHFGPGTESKVVSIEVRWLSRILQTVTDVA